MHIREYHDDRALSNAFYVGYQLDTGNGKEALFGIRIQKLEARCFDAQWKTHMVNFEYSALE